MVTEALSLTLLYSDNKVFCWNISLFSLCLAFVYHKHKTCIGENELLFAVSIAFTLKL